MTALSGVAVLTVGRVLVVAVAAPGNIMVVTSAGIQSSLSALFGFMWVPLIIFNWQGAALAVRYNYFDMVVFIGPIYGSCTT